MGCVRCQSEDSTDFPAAMQIYLDSARKTPVMFNSPVTVCFTCGFAGFPIHDEELQVPRQEPPLKNGA
jgi:hypothetical protein